MRFNLSYCICFVLLFSSIITYAMDSQSDDSSSGQPYVSVKNSNVAINFGTKSKRTKHRKSLSHSHLPSLLAESETVTPSSPTIQRDIRRKSLTKKSCLNLKNCRTVSLGTLIVTNLAACIAVGCGVYYVYSGCKTVQSGCQDMKAEANEARAMFFQCKDVCNQTVYFMKELVQAISNITL